MNDWAWNWEEEGGEEEEDVGMPKWRKWPTRTILEENGGNLAAETRFRHI
jgi:hypothetical protein